MKKITSMFLALVMALALAVPAFASANTGKVDVAGSINLPTVNVVLPTSASMVLNPYKLSVTLGKGETATTSTDQIISPTMEVKNLSNIGVQVAIEVTGSVGKGGSATFATATTADETDKTAFVYGVFAIGDTGATVSKPSGTASDNTYGQVIVSAEAKEVKGFESDAELAATGASANMLAPTAEKTPAEKGCLSFAFFGDAVAAPTKTSNNVETSDPWTDKDTMSVAVAFTFTPCAGQIVTGD